MWKRHKFNFSIIEQIFIFQESLLQNAHHFSLWHFPLFGKSSHSNYQLNFLRINTKLFQSTRHFSLCHFPLFFWTRNVAENWKRSNPIFLLNKFSIYHTVVERCVLGFFPISSTVSSNVPIISLNQHLSLRLPKTIFILQI